MRLFLGSFLNTVENIPLEEIQKLFAGNLKLIKKENIHMTWLFLGEVKEENLNTVIQTVEKHINIFKDLVFKSHGLRLWPVKKIPRLIILEGSLNKNVDLNNFTSELREISNVDEKDNFIPHITIARFKKDKTINKNTKLLCIKDFSWEIKEVSLVKSSLTSEGPVYEKIKEYL
ncbi:MAG: RNA 2',3'-cyclic phosphodiesterase [Candidatus Melainabacteria bacterium]|nr:RNA 2',3'-cyclic phosphodiesterase [Candidatus Melainabacteria bacterium]